MNPLGKPCTAIATFYLLLLGSSALADDVDEHRGAALVAGYSRAYSGRVKGSGGINGVDVSFYYAFNRRFRLNSFAGGYFGHVTLPAASPEVPAQQTHQEWVHVGIGPEFTSHRGRVTTFVHAMITYSVWDAGGSYGSPPSSPSWRETGVGAAVGGGLDVKLRSWIALRIIQFDWLPTHLSPDKRYEIPSPALPAGSGWYQNAVLSFGVVFGAR